MLIVKNLCFFFLVSKQVNTVVAVTMSIIYIYAKLCVPDAVKKIKC